MSSQYGLRVNIIVYALGRKRDIERVCTLYTHENVDNFEGPLKGRIPGQTMFTPGLANQPNNHD